jgi:CHAT domain-containing protein/tetratricopeptide (TPR) repeat protein
MARRRRAVNAVRSIVVLTTMCPLFQAPALTSGQEVPAQSASELKERDRLRDEAQKLRAEGKLAEAITAASGALAIERKILAADHDGLAGSLSLLAELLADREDFAAARAARSEALELLRKRHGPDHWKVTDARLALEDLERFATMPPPQRQKLAAADRLNNELSAHYQAGRYREALSPAQRALAIREEVLGEHHHLCAFSLNNLATILIALDAYADARRHYERALKINQKVLGERHPETADSLSNLGLVLVAQRDHAAAQALFERALAIRREVLGERHPDTAGSLNDLANLLKSEGDYAAARPLYERALEIRREAVGDHDPDFAVSMNNLAMLLEEQGDYAAARPLFEQAMRITKEAVGEKHPSSAAIMSNLALLLEEQGDYTAARPLCEQALEIQELTIGKRTAAYATSLNNLGALFAANGELAAARLRFEQALAIRKEVLGERHPDYTSSLNNLAHVLVSQGEYAAARPLYEQALAIGKAEKHEHRPDHAKALDNLAQLLVTQGDFAAARPLHEQARSIRKEVLHERHPAFAASLSNIGCLLWAQRDYTGAAPFLKQALEIDRGNLELAAAAQSERQQLAMAQAHRGRLDAYLSITPLAAQSPADAYRHLLVCKGAVFDRQQRLRAQRRHFQAGPASGAALRFAAYERTVRQLAELALAAPDLANVNAWRDKLSDLARRKDELEAELARLDAGFRADRVMASRTPEQLQADLPRGTALVDYLVYTSMEPPAGGNGDFQRRRQVVAFVVRPDRPIARVDLGPIAPIVQAIDAWRPLLISRQTAPSASEPALTLRRLIWKPVQPHLDGINSVLVSPDGPIGQVPLAALPGNEPKTYLIEERSIDVVPVPRLLASAVSPSKARDGRGPKEGEPAPSVLLAGDIDYGGDPGSSADRGLSRSAAADTRAGFRPDFKALPATRGEIKEVASSFEARFPKACAQILYCDRATEEAIRRQAPRSRYVHLATHGYFAPPELRSALRSENTGSVGAGNDPLGGAGLAGYHPGLLSGIVLAGANRRPTPVGREDGILTALEVAELDLGGVELAVLSACETGLGEVAGGEGLLGLQRAFQVAGAHSVVASLWNIGDEPTRALMTRFYENLWRKCQTPAAALRAAQLSMLHGDLWRGGLNQRGRGLSPIVKASPSDRVAPFYWAGFVLSTDRP